jgi:hypothetical protein
MDILYDGEPMAQQRGEKWCCLLCRRVFKEQAVLNVHMHKSELHQTNFAKAEKEGRISGGESKPLPTEGPTSQSSHTSAPIGGGLEQTLAAKAASVSAMLKNILPPGIFIIIAHLTPLNLLPNQSCC